MRYSSKLSSPNTSLSVRTGEDVLQSRRMACKEEGSVTVGGVASDSRGRV